MILLLLVIISEICYQQVGNDLKNGVLVCSSLQPLKPANQLPQQYEQILKQVVQMKAGNFIVCCRMAEACSRFNLPAYALQGWMRTLKKPSYDTHFNFNLL